MKRPVEPTGPDGQVPPETPGDAGHLDSEMRDIPIGRVREGTDSRLTPSEDTGVPAEEEAETRPPTAEELAELRGKAARHDEILARLQRATADYANSTKRLEREMQERSNYAIEAFALELLMVADDIARAVAAAREHNTMEQILDGLEIVEKHLFAVLERHGVTPMDTQPGQAFDPEWHEAVSVAQTDEHPPNRVLHEVQRGFRIHDRLLRAARVVVSAQPEGPPEPE